METMMLTVVTFVLFYGTCLGHWDNDFDGPLNFQCRDGGCAITRVKSIHNNHREDRRFELFCSSVGTSSQRASCHWTNYVNHYDQLVHYACPANSYMNGMHSIHSNRHEDRIWKYRCCSVPDVILDNCYLTGWTNHYDQPQDYRAPRGYVIKGSVSMHNNGREDRIFEFLICRVLHRRTTPKPKNLLDFLMIQQQPGQE